MSYNSKYKGAQVEALLDKVNDTDLSSYASRQELNEGLNDKQDAIEDLDAIRDGASKGTTALQSVPSEYVTESDLNSKSFATTLQLNEKVDKVTGKQLSTEDFTAALKNKLEGLSNYNDTEINNAVSNLQTQLNTLVNGNANDAINSFNEIIAFLDGIKDTEDLESIIASIEQQIAGKQDVINDLANIRSGAALGTTALQSVPEEYATEEWVENQGYLTSVATPDWIANRFESGFIKNRTHYLSGKSQSKSVNATHTRAGETLLGGLSAGQIVGIDNVTGANVDVIYVYVNNGDRISLPMNGPQVDAVIALVDDALAIVQNNDSYHIDNVLQFNVYLSVKPLDDYYIGPTIARKNDVNVLSNDITEQLTNKQDTLVSGTNIKTINGENILGSGNISISGGTSDLSNYYTKTEIDVLVGDINSVLESIISGGASGKTVNNGIITWTGGIAATYTLTFEYPVASDVEIESGDLSITVLKGSTYSRYTIVPGETIGSTVNVNPTEDETYIYKVTMSV